jgi:hypothetical protein
MHAVVNKLSLGKPIDQALLTKIETGLGTLLADHPDFVRVQIVNVSDAEAILVALYKTLEGLNEISKNIAGPWFAEHVRPYLAGPVDRAVGEVVLDFANGG